MNKRLLRFSIATLAMLALGFPMASIAGVKPIVGLPDYNGTYYGTPGTGRLYSSSSWIFSTLYRDNYDRLSGCAGEGCGKHPGVDIRVDGKQVKAALAGKVIRSECSLPGSGNFGGLIVIEANNPYISGQKVYVSYAHLKERYSAVNAIVSQGKVIGRSGGAPDNDCPGGSFGAHLHFQVDKPHGGPYPWYPFGRVENRDDDFEVTDKTYNPLPFVTAGGWQNWTFADRGFFEHWGVDNATASGVERGYVWLDSSSPDTAIHRSGLTPSSCGGGEGYPCSREVTVEANIYKRLRFALSSTVLGTPFRCTS